MMRFKFLLLFLAILFTGIQTYSQVAINKTGDAADPSSMLDVSSDTAGVLIPRMTATQRDAINSPETGLMVYVSDDNSFYYYDGSDWVILNGLWVHEGDTLSPKSETIPIIDLKYTPSGTTQQLTIIRAVNENDASNYTGAVFVAKGSGKLCKRYWDNSKEGLRTANCPWTISIKKGTSD